MSERDPISAISAATQKKIQELQKAAKQEQALIVESEEDLNQFFELSAFNPAAQMQKFRDFSKLKKENTERQKADESKTEAKIIQKKEVEETATRFQGRNNELLAKTLLILRARILPSDTPEEILEKILDTYSDVSLADEALDFLLETADPALLPKLRQVKQQLLATRAREITAGRNIALQAKQFSEEGLGSPTSLRDVYRDVTETERDSLELFREMTEKFPYEKLKTAINFLLYSLGADLRAKGSSISKLELKKLMDETRSLQGILGVFRFFQSRMGLIAKLFSSYNLLLPPRLTFEVLAKMFIRLLAERYMSPEKILQTAKALGLAEEIAAQIIIYAQMRDGIRQVAPRYYRSQQHKEEVSKSFLDALEDLEDQLEELEEFQQEEERKRKKQKPTPQEEEEP